MDQQAQPQWAIDLTTAYPAAKWPPNYFKMIKRFIDRNQFSPQVVQQGIDNWIVDNTAPYASPTPGQFTAYCNAAKSLIEGAEIEADRQDKAFNRAWSEMCHSMKSLSSRQAVAIEKFQQTGDITILIDFAFACECADYDETAAHMWRRIRRIRGGQLKALVEAIRPVTEATPV